MSWFISRVYLFILAIVLVWPAGAAGAEPLRTIPLPGPGFYQVGPHGQRVYRPRQAVADRLIIGLRPGVHALGVGTPAALAVQGGGQMRKLLTRGQLMVVDLPADSDLQAAAQRFQQLPNVAFVVPDTIVYPLLTPNDPKYGQQYHLPLIQAPAAWDVTTGSPSSVIAGVDSGVDLNHPDLAGKIWTNPNPGSDPRYPDDLHGWNFVDNDNNVSPVPVHGGDNSIVAHGTLAAGIAAAMTNDNYGTAGVNWAAQIMPLKVFGNDGYGATSSTIVEAIDYAVAHGAKIINLSLGEWGFNPVYTPPIKVAYEAGVVVVAAAGNDGRALTDSSSSQQSPACNDSDASAPDANWVIGVTATNQFDQRADFSNWDQSTRRTFVDVCAPGVAIYGPLFQDSSFPEFTQYFGTNTGTSFATPMVAGLAALILAVHPSYTPAQVMAAIRGGADNIDSINVGYAGMLGAGRINLARSLGVVSPPQPARNVAAADTSGDSGGSITVTWLKSSDDGGGANNVTKYVIRRRQGVSGSFSAIGEVPPGTQQYVDSTTTDGLSYYYQVRTYAGTLYSDSPVAGPAESRDDTPPAQITTLQATDRPGDSGGTIVLTWTYTPPEDFAAYRVYRDSYAFTTVIGRTPIATLTDKGATSYTDTTVSDGVDYYYAMTAVDNANNERTTVVPVGPVQSYPNENMVFPAGLQLLATPALPADRHPATLFGPTPYQLQYACYDTASREYLYYTGEPLPAELRLELGKGFWVNLGGQVMITPEGESAPAGDFPVTITPGWRLLGNPFFAPLDFSTCTVTSDGNTMDLWAAQSKGLIYSVAWVWDTTAKSYRMVNEGSSVSTISSWQGFWVQGLGNCTLNLTRPVGTEQSVQRVAALHSTASRPTVQWRVRLTAEAGGYRDLDNYCGVASVAQAIASPPLPGAGVELALGQSEAGPVALRYFTADTETVTQPLTVSWQGVSGAVRLAWPEINLLAAQHDFLLKDEATGQITNLRSQPAYVFQAAQTAGKREFTLTVTPRAVGTVILSQISAHATGSGGAHLVFALSKAANCDIKILNLAGRVIRELASGTPRPAGQSTVLWDGRNQGGVRVPSGLYLVSLVVRDDQGGMASAVRSLSLTR
ncbi:MAG: S8 family serine peptidase [candidate division WS1 bacterium]|nr:S8 family serine peptidase [candidate division WS1 bacterium]